MNREYFLKRFGKKLREQREREGRSQEWLANKVGYSRTQIVNLEAGRSDIPLSRFPSLLKALNCYAYALLPK
jgi:DNA-binding XRE family transcriptional regulator